MTVSRTLHQMWLSDGPPMPDTYAEWCEQWRELHPDWTYLFWTEPPLLRNQSLYDNATNIAPKAVQQFQADVARYEILAEYGGVWMDADTMPHKALDDLMGKPWVVRHSGKWFANGIMGMTAGHPLLAEAVERLPSQVAKAQPHWGNTRRSGPQFLTPLLRPYVRRGEIVALPESFFLPFDWDHPQGFEDGLRGEYGTHVWSNQRRKRGIPLPTTMRTP